MATETTRKPRKTTTRKPAVTKVPAEVTSEVPTQGPAELAFGAADPVVAASAPAALRLKALVDRVTAGTGGNKKGVKEIVEATLAELGRSLARGEMLNLPALGRIRVARVGGGAGGALTLKLRPAGDSARAKPGKKPAKETLAEPADQG